VEEIKGLIGKNQEKVRDGKGCPGGRAFGEIFGTSWRSREGLFNRLHWVDLKRNDRTSKNSRRGLTEGRKKRGEERIIPPNPGDEKKTFERIEAKDKSDKKYQACKVGPGAAKITSAS